ncbi:MAG: protein translocase subunit SecD [Candidatus Velthaea sp.]|jgi:preprotein translocase subunit SecD
MWNKLKGPLKAVLLLVIVGLCVWAFLPIQQKIHLGLDLQGGVQVLLQLEPTETVPKITPDVQSQIVQVIDQRVNGLGVSEPVITRVGTDRVQVDLPGVKDPDQVERTLKETAVLEFKIVPPAVSQRANADKKYAADPNGAYKDSGPTVYSGAELKGAQAAYGQAGDNQIDFQTKDPKKFGALTHDNLGKLLGIFLDKKFISDATIEGVITDSGMIHGSFTEDDTVRIANELNAGALPVPTRIIEKAEVGPTLGADDLKKSLYASILGLTLVLVFMAVVYRLPGLLADLALVVYVLALLALLAAAHAVLTLPGIAGFVLSIGMAVDANVLIFERMKEELWSGKSLRSSVKIGFQRAFTSVFDSHFTTIVGAGVLFLLGTGTVKGFAYTLFWGTAFSLITAVFVTRFFVDVVVDNDLVTDHKAYGA